MRHNETPGGLLLAAITSPADETGLLADANASLDARDAEHLTAHGHLPGRDVTCTIKSRDEAMGPMLQGLRQRGAAWSGSSQDLADATRRLNPTNYIVVGAEQPPDGTIRQGVQVVSRVRQPGFGDDWARRRRSHESDLPEMRRRLVSRQMRPSRRGDVVPHRGRA